MYSLLYIDDEPALQELGKVFLERTQIFSVVTKTSVDEGLESLKQKTFDAIISDYAMPGKDGIEFLKTVRAEYGDVPFIIFTGKGREDVVIEAFNHGANFYLQKGGQPKAQFAELAHQVKTAIEHKCVERSLVENEQRYKAVVEDQTEFITRFTPDGMLTFVNEAFCRYFRVNREEILGKKFIPRIPAEDKPAVRKHFGSFTCENPTATIIHRIVLNDGEIRWHKWTDRAFFDNNGIIFEYQSVGRDITSQKHTEMELEKNRDSLNMIYTSVQAGILIIDAKTHDIIDANPAAAKMVGAEKKEILGKVCHNFICPAENGKCPITDLGLPCDNSERVLLTADGKKKSILKNVAPIMYHGRDCLLETFIDNTQRKQAEEELQAAYSQLSATEKELKQKFEELQKSQEIIAESEKVYRTIFENTGTATLIIEEDNTISLINSQCEQLSGYTKDEIEGKRKWTEFVDREDLQKMVSYNKERWKSDTNVPRHYEFRLITKESNIKSVLLSIGPIPGTKKAVASLLDVTEYKRMEDALQQKSARSGRS